MAIFDAAWPWLATGLSGQAHTIPPAWAFWHARLMVVGWSILIPLGMLVARFFKIWPGQRWPEVLDNPAWWRLHVGLQSLGVAVMSLGVLLAFGRGAEASSLALWHHRAGWALLAVGWTQVAAGLLRGSKGGPGAASLRGDHYDMTRRRLAFEYLHKSLGWAALPVVAGTTAVGLLMLDAPRWMALLIGGWWAALAGAFALLQASGRCLDTYQAIWGPAPEHPGNARRPIGWRVGRRPHVQDRPRAS